MSNISRRHFLKGASLLGGGLATFGLSLTSSPVQAKANRSQLPYYKAGAPLSDDVRSGVGENLLLQGIVYQQDGKTPLSNATVEIWHCDAKGKYDFSEEFSYRSKVLTDSQGRYSFKTHFPGRYLEGNHYKTSRIFMLVQGKGFQDSFAQLYFDSRQQPYIDRQHWEACPMPERPTLPKLSRGIFDKTVTFHQYLNPA